MRRFAPVLCAFLALLNITLSAAAQSSVSVQVGLTGIANLDPVGLPRDHAAERDVVENLFVGLTRVDPATGNIEKMLAREWTVSPDGLTWTFKLRTDIQWVRRNPQSGQIEAVRPVAPGDFVYAIRRACDAVPPHPAAPSVFIIAGCAVINNANPVQVNDVFIARTLGMTASGADKLEIRLAFPAAYFPALLALPEFRPVPREAIARDPAWGTKAETLITNGPFALKSWTPGAALELMRNPQWPDKFAGNVSDVTIPVPLPDLKTLDAARLDPAAIASAQTAGMRVQTSPASVTVLGFSMEREGVSNDAIRRSFALSIDRGALVAAFPPGTVQAASRFIPTGKDDNSGFAPEAAKAALATTSMSGCARIPAKFDLAYGTDPVQAALAQALVAGWQKTLGCNAANTFTLRKLADDYLLGVAHASVNVDENQKGAPRPHLWIATWAPDYADLNAWLGDGVQCRVGFLRSGLACGPADDLVDAASRETDFTKRQSAYDQAEALWFGPNGSFPVAPLFVTLEARGAQPWVTGLSARGALRFDLWTVDTAKRG